MARLNVKVNPMTETTHEGAPAYGNLKPIQQLKRSVMSCFLWENEFYEDGEEIAKRIYETALKCKPSDVAQLAIEARTKGNLRHVPLLLLCALAKIGSGTSILSDTIPQVVNRADELAELIAVYWRDGKKPLAAQMKKGLAKAFLKFDEYQLAKYNRDSAIKLRDVLFLVRPKPKGKEQVKLFKKLAENELKTPDTWEVALSAGADKKKTFERLIKEKNLGAFAFLRNLRNMHQAGVTKTIINKGFETAKGFEKILPFRYISAAQAVPQLEQEIDKAFLKAMEQRTKLPGKTILIIDVSGSMYGGTISKYSEMDRAKAACALGAVVRELCEEPIIYATAGNDGSRQHKTAVVPARRGMALVDAIYSMSNPLGGGGIFLKQVMDYTYEQEKTADRVIVITDEQDCDAGVKATSAHLYAKNHYLINVASNKNGIGYGPWIHIDGFSERVIDFIHEYENLEEQE